ncbi:hypothetical protein EPN83_00405 [Patescibacteria group bacterium]|nr:MAG: hypothetical protein EPN83_00405 [Patescibacteria group bacterium]
MRNPLVGLIGRLRDALRPEMEIHTISAPRLQRRESLGIILPTQIPPELLWKGKAEKGERGDIATCELRKRAEENLRARGLQ